MVVLHIINILVEQAQPHLMSRACCQLLVLTISFLSFFFLSTPSLEQARKPVT
jgi:hypothetical protein